MRRVKGVIAAIVTLYKENGRVNAPSLETISNYLASSGVIGIMTNSGTGE